MNYKEIREYITEKEKLGSVFGLDMIRELLRRLGNPERGIPAIHIGGTNGKGSILSYVEEALVDAGYTVGRYISPTIYDYRERWRRNKLWASEDEVAEAITEVAAAVNEMEEDGLGSPTAFEIETAAAFLMYRKWDVDIMLVECGMGGLMDATNIIEDDVINVLASISRDHMMVLGDTIEEITRQKLGIVRAGSELVSYPQVKEAYDVIKDYSQEHYVNLIEADPDKLEIIRSDYKGSIFNYKGKDYRISIGGEYQVFNAITAIEVLEAFYNRFAGNGKAECPDKDTFDTITSRALEKTRWDGRFSIISENPVIIVDGAHNEDAWLQLRRSLEDYFTNRRFIYIIGVLRDKEYKKMIDILSPTMGYVYAVESSNSRTLSADELCEELTAVDVDAVSMGRDTDTALEAAMRRAAAEDVIVVCGTLSITGEIIRCIESMK